MLTFTTCVKYIDQTIPLMQTSHFYFHTITIPCSLNISLQKDNKHNFKNPSHTNITKKRKTMAEPNKTSCTKSINVQKKLCTSNEKTFCQSNSRASKTNSNYEDSNDPKTTSTFHPLPGPYTATDNDLYQKCRKLGVPFQQPALDETNYQRKLRNRRNNICGEEVTCECGGPASTTPPPPPHFT